METYYWSTENEHANNTETMQDYLNNHLSSIFLVITEDGSYAEIHNPETHETFGVHASGNGDFRNHKVEFKLINTPI